MDILDLQLQFPDGDHNKNGDMRYWHKEHIGDKIMNKSSLTDFGMVNLDETISTYFYIILVSQVEARISLPDISVVDIII